jgi:hypothetical protein
MGRRFVLLVLAVAVCLPALQWLFKPGDVKELRDGLASWQRAYALDEVHAERDALRRSNPEWDLMVRTFSALAFANLALAEPWRRGEHLEVVDAWIDRTLRDERQAPDAFLLPYVHGGKFRDRVGRSLFVDGELALMLAARQTVAARRDYAPLLRERVDLIVAQLERGPVLSGESYPDEAWTFCNTLALAAVRMSDRVDGRDHSVLLRRWVASARAHLVDPRSGLLVSSFTYDGAVKDGPEGSSLWLAAHMLQWVDEDFAREQYQRARAALLRRSLGFAWAAEWPRGVGAVQDIDSGPTIPGVDANAGSSGLALVGAAAFDDAEVLDGLLTSLRFAAFPVRDEHGLRFAAGNALADAVLLYALSEGPLWRLARLPWQGGAR